MSQFLSNPYQVTVPDSNNLKYIAQVVRATTANGTIEQARELLLSLWTDNNTLICTLWDEEQVQQKAAEAQAQEDTEQVAKDTLEARDLAIAKSITSTHW